MVEFQRATAYKLWISDLLNGSYTKGSGQFDIGYVEVLGKKISKVNIVGGVIDRFNGENYTNLTIDDGSGNLSLRAFNEDVKIFNEVKVGDLILVIGKTKEFNNKIFVNPEVVRKLDNPLWLKLRRLELINLYGETSRAEVKSLDKEEVTFENVVEEKIEDVNSRGIVLELIEKLDSGNGAALEEVVEQSRLRNADKIIEDLIIEGEVFEVQRGKLRVMG